MFTPRAVLDGDVKHGHLLLLSLIVEETRKIVDGPRITCHSVCEWLAVCLPGLVHRRGWFGRKRVEHSWLVAADDPDVVFDVYPVAGVVPFLVTKVGLLNPWATLYMEDPQCPENHTPLRPREPTPPPAAFTPGLCGV